MIATTGVKLSGSNVFLGRLVRPSVFFHVILSDQSRGTEIAALNFVSGIGHHHAGLCVPLFCERNDFIPIELFLGKLAMWLFYIVSLARENQDRFCLAALQIRWIRFLEA